MAPKTPRGSATPRANAATSKPGAPSKGATPKPAVKKGKAPRTADGETAAVPARVAKPPAPRDGYVAVAEVARPHGIQGEIRLKLYNPDSDLLTRRPRVRLRMPDGQARDVAMTSAREANKALLVRFEGVDDRNAVEALRGAEVCVPRDAFPALESGEFYACDLEGARAVMRSGEELGRVSGITSYPTCAVLVVDRASGGHLEVPLLDAYVGSVDAAGGVVEIITVEGLD